jgi:biotin-independent malonate decarboxylase beta subunit
VTSGAVAQDWHQILARRSFIEGDALERATALLDPDSARVLCGPFDRLESPWLVPQGIVPQADDGVVIARGTLDGRPTVIASIEQGFQGGGTGEVSGAKISQALRLAVDDSRAGMPTAAVLLFETGGVRLQEANLGLNAVAEICSAVLDLRPMAPVIGVVAGEVGSFGGMSIAAGLCTRLIITPQGRIGLNGPAVIEQEGGIDEFDSSDRALIWSIDGGEQRAAIGLADKLVTDDRDLLRAAVIEAVAAGVPPAGSHRSERVDALGSRLASFDPRNPPAPQDLRRLWGPKFEPVDGATPAAAATPSATTSRGRVWLSALAATEPVAVIPSVIRADTADATYLAVVPDPQNPFHRARNGEVGLTESWALGVRSTMSSRRTRSAPLSPSSTCPARHTAASRRWRVCTTPSPSRSMRITAHATPVTRRWPSWSGTRYRAGSWPTACRPSRYSPSTTPEWKSMRCTRPRPPGSRCARWTNSTSWPKRLYR